MTNVTNKTKVKRRGISRGALFLRNSAMVIPLTIFALLIIMAVFAPWIAPYDPLQTSILDKYKPPFFMDEGSTKYILGTDKLGRDILSRLIYGARVSLSVSLLVIAITAFVGTIIGIAAGYLGGKIDATLMRITDISMAFPGLLLAMLLSVSLGPGYLTVVLALSILGWAPYARLIRGEALRLRSADFVAQAQIIGSSQIRIMIRHIFPNVVNPLIVVVTMAVGMMILAESALSYLGIGIPAPTPSWGSIVADGRDNLDAAWWISLFPGICIGLVVLSGNFLGDWIRDKVDPRLRRL